MKTLLDHIIQRCEELKSQNTVISDHGVKAFNSGYTLGVKHTLEALNKRDLAKKIPLA